MHSTAYIKRARTNKPPEQGYRNTPPPSKEDDGLTIEDFIPTIDDLLYTKSDENKDEGDFKLNDHNFNIQKHAWPILRNLLLTIFISLAIVWFIGKKFTSNLQSLLDNPVSRIKDLIHVVISFVFSKVVYIYIPIMSLLYTVAINYSYQQSNSIKIRENIYFFHILLFGSDGLLSFLLNFAKMLVIFGVLKVLMDRGVSIRNYIHDSVPRLPHNPLSRSKGSSLK